MTKKNFFCVLAIMFMAVIVNAQGGAVYLNASPTVTFGSPVLTPILNPFGIKWSNTITGSFGEIITVSATAVP